MIHIFRVLAWPVLILSASALFTTARAGDVQAETLVAAASEATLKRTPAKKLFGSQRRPADLRPRAIGTYTRGCLAGARAMPINGSAWQVMRLSRNRNWGHPKLISYLEKLAKDVKAKDNWPGLLIGDLAQPRGGPMLSGHASHQLGLDADIWLMAMPTRTLGAKEREKMSAVSMLSKDKKRINRKAWKPGHLRVIKRAASDQRVARIFLHPVIKRELCRTAGKDRAWLRKVRPWWGHHYHFHVRLRCQPGSPRCKDQNAPPEGDGCGKEVSAWYKRMFAPRPEPAKKPKTKTKKPRIVTINDLPKQCRTVLYAK